MMDLKFRSTYPGDDWAVRVSFASSQIPYLSLWFFCGFFPGYVLGSIFRPESWGMKIMAVMVVAVVVCSILFMIGRAVRRCYRNFPKLMELYPSLNMRGTKEISDKGVATVLDDGTRGDVPWSCITDVCEGRDYFSCVCGSHVVFLINKNDLTDDQAEELRAWLTGFDKWGKGKPGWLKRLYWRVLSRRA